MSNEFLRVRGAREHNLKNISVDIPKNALVVVTGLSGSGKSSLAFDTVHAEGQRRYMESLSSYARQFLELQDKPDVDEISGLSPTVAIDQKSSSHNPRSTVGTVTEVYDYLRVLFARAGVAHCPDCGGQVIEQTLASMVARTQKMLGTELVILAPLVRSEKGEHKQVLAGAETAGFTEARFDGFVTDLDELVRMRKDKKKEHTIEAVVAKFFPEDEPTADRIKDVLKRALEYGNGLVIILDNQTGDELLLSQSLACPDCGVNLPKPEPRLFSFNSPAGACRDCMGLGVKLVLEEDLVIPNKRLTFAEGAVKPWTRIAGNQTSYLRLLEIVGKKHGFSINVPVDKIPNKKMEIVLRGSLDDVFKLDGVEMVFPGILTQLEEKYRSTDSDYVRSELEGYMRKMTCPGCHGHRLRKESLAIKLWDKTISDLAMMPLEDLAVFFENILKTKKIDASNSLSEEQILVVGRVQKEVQQRLHNMLSVGLGYITLDRSAMSLSGGESQRMRLATQLAASLSGVIYILDEPSIGLHPRDNGQLIETIKALRDAGNTVIVVEHDEAMMHAADYIFDMGPGAGEYGGEVIAEGTAEQIKKNKDSLTGLYLSGKKVIPSPRKYRDGNKKKMTIHGASENNLQDVTVDIPLGKLVCVTGV
ncbi:MAG: excinuclease ABC subunit UvrA [bacterium]|nr:excinuclease ABC subunit UvrA [bacterium]